MSTAQQVFRELEQKIWKPFYVVSGEEPFQTAEIVSRIRQCFFQAGDDTSFQYEFWDGEGLDGRGLLESLETLPGLFATPDSVRLVRCDRFEKVPASQLEILESYFERPSETTCFLILASKIDKRKSWVKKVQEAGHLIEVAEPYDRDWPKWLPYFEKKSGKKISPKAWEWVVAAAGRQLSLVWSEIEKTSVYVGGKQNLALEDFEAVVGGAGQSDVFQLAQDVIQGDRFHAVQRYRSLLREGENEVKILSILVRQFRVLDKVQRLLEKGVSDPKVVASQAGVHPYFVPQVIRQAKAKSASSVDQGLRLLAECDFNLKTGNGSLFEGFLIPYFS